MGLLWIEQSLVDDCGICARLLKSETGGVAFGSIFYHA